MTKTTRFGSDISSRNVYYRGDPHLRCFTSMFNAGTHDVLMREIAVAIIEDNRYVREAWGAVVDTDESMSLVGSYGSCEDAFADAAFAEAEVVLMDIGLPGMSGIEGVERLKRDHPDMHAVMCTVYEDDNNIFNAICAGAVGYILKKTPPEDVVIAIRLAAAGGSPMTPAIARKVIQSFHRNDPVSPANDIETLTSREQEVLERLVQGKSYSAIAGELFISVDGVRYHLRHIYEKLHVRNRAEAVARGLKEKLVQPPR